MNAGKRLLYNIRREHPHLKLTVVEDALYSNGPHIELLKELQMNFIIGVKPTGNASLFDWIEGCELNKFQCKDKDGNKHYFEYLNKVPLNDTHSNIEVNFLKYKQVSPKGKELNFSWVTDIELNDNNIKHIMRGGRSRWKIENETHNTLKNQGYNYEHNYGHGYKNLCTVMDYLLMIAFLIDQIQFYCSSIFRDALTKCKAKYVLWERVRIYFSTFIIDSWDKLYKFIIDAGDIEVSLP